MRQKDQYDIWLEEILDELVAAGEFEVVRIDENGNKVYRKIADLGYCRAKVEGKLN